MKALLQRVSAASVRVDGDCVGEIGQGLLVLLGVEKDDDDETLSRMAEKILKYRVFADSEDKMNLSVMDIAGSVLMVPQFTLAADTRKGLRPSFSSALPPAAAEALYQYTLQTLRGRHPDVAAGVFGADMQVSLVNDGPVTFLLES